MCRVLAYLGDPLPLSELLYASDNSLVSQSYAPQMIGMLNLAGFGMVAWDPGSHAPGTPFQYHTPGLPALDANLAALARKVRGDSVLAHVRGVRLDGSAQVGPQYLHPFLYPGCSVALAHNGDLHDFADLRPWLQTEIKPAINRLLRTTLDSEWIYALLLSRLADPGAEHNATELAQALVDTLAIIAAARKRAGQRSSSSANLFVADANNIVAARYCFDFGCAAADTRPGMAPAPYLSLWYSLGQRYGCHEGEWKLIGGRGQPRAVLLASEPLTRDTSTWLEVPEYSLVAFERRAGQARVLTRQITL
jgi:predicted glutamine amidotransferase